MNRVTWDVEFVIWSAWCYVDAPFAQTVADKLNEKLQPLMGKPQVFQTLPLQVVEVKPMADGGLNVYIQPIG